MHAAWEPVCEACGAFDSLDWKEPAHPEDAGLSDSSLLPLIVGAAGEPAPGEPAPPESAIEPGIEDAELATVADRARAAGGG
jgi:HemY protein